ncbi:hypothetical protein B1A99_33700 [Cohnella sp. CIP 111063]|uniref:TOTE conflict system archaeo-eukaryotic primase domain-containing protein n=1 Tax=unclassified Cohnella TaxID=2636738 RepID=UPI000B8BFC1A|nr:MULTISPECIES: hypothetical protein [unclassified Cohnella]OXS52540.1 hypothetical protein B1A99_33700 [Cohnella sp. CIP 111063]PRX58811.1 hypothetical protein B0G52_13442 [Cohnella sp. SGD-V74]
MQQQIMDRFFDLYLIQHKRYLMQFKGGEYKQNKAQKPLKLYHLQKHLEGERTIGTFSGTHLTKFICFDIDYPEPKVAKWITYKITDVLARVGIQNYAVSFSGQKGYHVEFFLDKAISTELARRFFSFILSAAEIPVDGAGQVEYRPSTTQGVKLPLGVHQKTGDFCGFCCVSDGLRVMDRDESISYLLTIKKTDSDIILNVITDEYAYSSGDITDMEDTIAAHKPLEAYDQSESYTVSRTTDLYYKGMSGPSQRHNSFMLLARLMNHNGVDPADSRRMIMDWLDVQDKRFYRSTRDVCVKDAENIVDFVYTNNLTLAMEERDLTVSFDEIDAIIRRCGEKNQKALMYAILIHSKRWAAGEGGTFYMTFKQMEETAGINMRTAMRLIKDLEDLGVIEVARRDQKQKGTSKKIPNVYRVTLRPVDEPILGGDRQYVIQRDSGLRECLRFFYTDKMLRNLLPRRQYSKLILAS